MWEFKEILSLSVVIFGDGCPLFAQWKKSKRDGGERQDTTDTQYICGLENLPLSMIA